VDEVIEIENSLLDLAVTGGANLPFVVRRHLMEGFVRRLLMLQESRLFLRDIAISGGGPKDSSEAVLMAIHLNSLYLNLLGALDNLAWALNAKFRLGLREEDASRRRCALFGKHFLELVEGVDAPLAVSLREFATWASEVKDLRDPAAHRVPMYPVPGVLRPEQREEWEALNEELTRAAEAGETVLPVLARQRGVYEPVMALSGPEGLVIRDLHEQVRTDYGQFLSVSGRVLPVLLRVWYVGCRCERGVEGSWG